MENTSVNNKKTYSVKLLQNALKLTAVSIIFIGDGFCSAPKSNSYLSSASSLLSSASNAVWNNAFIPTQENLDKKNIIDQIVLGTQIKQVVIDKLWKLDIKNLKLIQKLVTGMNSSDGIIWCEFFAKKSFAYLNKLASLVKNTTPQAKSKLLDQSKLLNKFYLDDDYLETIAFLTKNMTHEDKSILLEKSSSLGMDAPDKRLELINKFNLLVSRGVFRPVLFLDKPGSEVKFVASIEHFVKPEHLKELSKNIRWVLEETNVNITKGYYEAINPHNPNITALSRVGDLNTKDENWVVCLKLVPIEIVALLETIIAKLNKKLEEKIIDANQLKDALYAIKVLLIGHVNKIYEFEIDCAKMELAANEPFREFKQLPVYRGNAETYDQYKVAKKNAQQQILAWQEKLIRHEKKLNADEERFRNNLQSINNIIDNEPEFYNKFMNYIVPLT